MPTRHLLQPVLLTTLLGLTLAAAPSPALTLESGQTRLTPTQRRQLFPEWRRLTLETTRGRIAILQKKQQCVTAANSLEALKICQQQERQALINQQRQQHQALRQLLERYGITLPPRQQGRDRGVPGQPSDTPML